MTREKTQFAVCVGAAFGILMGTTRAGDTGYTLDRTALHAGGPLTGGLYELSGAVGQSGAAVQSGGGYTLSAGFQAPIPPADCDGDGGVTRADYAAFRACLTGPNGPTPDGCQCYDTDRDGAVDLLDFAAAQAAFGEL